jgi:hypothetical protein
LKTQTCDKTDLEQDLYNKNGLKGLETYFNKRMKEIQKAISRSANECEAYRRTITDLEYEQFLVQKQIVINCITSIIFHSENEINIESFIETNQFVQLR